MKNNTNSRCRFIPSIIIIISEISNPKEKNFFEGPHHQGKHFTVEKFPVSDTVVRWNKAWNGNWRSACSQYFRGLVICGWLAGFLLRVYAINLGSTTVKNWDLEKGRRSREDGIVTDLSGSPCCLWRGYASEVGLPLGGLWRGLSQKGSTSREVCLHWGLPLKGSAFEGLCL